MLERLKAWCVHNHMDVIALLIMLIVIIFGFEELNSRVQAKLDVINDQLNSKIVETQKQVSVDIKAAADTKKAGDGDIGYVAGVKATGTKKINQRHKQLQELPAMIQEWNKDLVFTAPTLTQPSTRN